MNIIYENSKNAKSAKILQQEVGATALLLKNSADRKDNYHPLCLVQVVHRHFARLVIGKRYLNPNQQIIFKCNLSKRGVNCEHCMRYMRSILIKSIRINAICIVVYTAQTTKCHF